MGSIKIHEFIAVDGVFEDPSWTQEFAFDPRMGEAIGAVMGSCSAILLGRRTFEMFAPAWSSRPADAPGAAFMNESPKYVVCGSPTIPAWRNSERLGPYRPDAIRELKAGVEGGIYVSGSGTLVRALLADGLADELHLFVYPVLRGSGLRLFADGGPVTTFTLAGSEAYPNGVVHLTYTPGSAG